MKRERRRSEESRSKLLIEEKDENGAGVRTEESRSNLLFESAKETQMRKGNKRENYNPALLILLFYIFLTLLYNKEKEM